MGAGKDNRIEQLEAALRQCRCQPTRDKFNATSEKVGLKTRYIG